jgi:multicomponent K+:H+ antiporter subunit A
MSIFAMAAGALIYGFGARWLAAGPEGPPVLHLLRAQRVYERIMLLAAWTWPRAAYRLFGTGRLQSQMSIVVLLAFAVAAAILGNELRVFPELDLAGPNLAFALLWLVGATCAIGAAWQAKYHRFAALILLGGAGLATCVTFAWLSAPDLAMTQLLVEIITTVLLLLGLRWLPRRREEIREDTFWPARLRRGRDLVIAGACGVGIAMVAFTLMTTQPGIRLGDWFLRNAYYEGGGTNVVNVILVDFRAFDTFGEITVLAIVGLTVFALLRRFRPSEESAGAPMQQEGGEDGLRDYLFIPSVLMQWMFPAIIMLAAYLFFRGHDLPGGGFAAGVALAIGLLLQYLAATIRWVEMRIFVLPIRWMGFGLMAAVGTGIGSWLAGYPFLTSYAQYVDLPFIGEVPMTTAMAFDAGVFALVLGATVLMQIAIAHQSLRTRAAKPAGDPEAADERST